MFAFTTTGDQFHYFPKKTNDENAKLLLENSLQYIHAYQSVQGPKREATKHSCREYPQGQASWKGFVPINPQLQNGNGLYFTWLETCSAGRLRTATDNKRNNIKVL